MSILSRSKLAVWARGSLLRHDSIRLTAATAVVVVSLFGLYCVTVGEPSSPVMTEATAAARLADTQRQEALAFEARRRGTILFVSTDKYCEEHKFDNVTGQTLAIDYVDCEERLARDANVNRAAKTSNMKGMLASFKR